MSAARASVAFASAVLASLVLAPQAVGQQITRVARWTRVSLVHAACDAPPFDRERYAALVQLEIASAGAAPDAESVDAPEVAATLTDTAERCTPDAPRVTLVFAVIATGRAAERVVEVGDVALGERPRLLALAAAELVRANENVLSEPLPPAPAVVAPIVVTGPSGAPPSSEHRAATRHAPWERVSVGASGAGRFYARPGVPGAFLGGGRIDIAFPLPNRWLAARFGALALDATADDRIGTVDLFVGAFDAGLFVVLPTVGNRAATRIGFVAEVAVGVASGRPASRGIAAGAYTSALGAGALVLGVDVALSRNLALTSEVEFGAAVGGVDAQADGRTVISASGGFAGLRLGALCAP